ncbi:MAG: hypothetical protein NC548_54220 [Lachnospiraceae bacterium]|nr:hypothetical protein [Lachnospiraceae bacterium]
MTKEIIDCHYCEYSMCQDEKSSADCYAEDNCYFSHHVEDSKKEAENCPDFEFCDILPKC